MSGVIINPYMFVEESSQIIIEGTSNSTLSQANRTTHEYTHSLTSTSQDGTLALIIVFHGDRGGENDVTPDKGTAILDDPDQPAGPGKLWIGYYVPDANDISAGEVAFDYTTSQAEGCQFFIYEVRGLDLSNLPTSLVADTAFEAANTNVTSRGPLTVTAPANSMIIACATNDNDTDVTMSVGTANGFTTDRLYQTGTNDSGLAATHLMVETADDYSTPIFELDIADAMAVGAVVLKSA